MMENINRNKGAFNLAGKKVMIGLPAYDHKVSIKLAIGLARLAQMVVAHGIHIEISSVCGCSVVSRARNLIAYDFLKSDCDHLLFIDADINFEPDSVLRLLAWNQHRAIVAGGYESRKPGKNYILTLDNADGNLRMDGYGLVKAKRVATGFMMIQRKVFEKLRDDHPEWEHHDTSQADKMLYCFFDFQLKDRQYTGEDFLFCQRAIDAGFDDIWIDPVIKLGHMGITEYQSDFGNDILYPLLPKIDQEGGLSTAA